MFTKKQLKILERAAATETKARSLEVRFEFVEDGIHPVFPESVLKELLEMFAMEGEKQDKYLVNLSYDTLLVLAELEGDVDEYL